MVIVVHYTRFARANLTTSKSAETVADKILNNYAMKFGLPLRIHHDQGGEFRKPVICAVEEELWGDGLKNNTVPPMTQRVGGAAKQNTTANAENAHQEEVRLMRVVA